MPLHLTLTSPTAFDGLTIVPTPAPETVTLETASKEVGDIRMLDGKAVLSLGPQDKINAEMIRRAGGMLAKWLTKHEVASAGLELSPLFGFDLTPQATLQALVEGLLLGNFKFDNYKSDKKSLDITLTLLVEGETASLQKALEKATIVSEAANLAREWSHEPGNIINPVTLVERVQKLAAEVGLKCTVLDDKQLEAMGAGAIVAVGKASATPSRLIILEHAGTTNEQPVALVGKALTFDSGGYSLKSSEGISTMKYDKSGGMTVIATLVAAARLKLPVPVVGVIPSAENMISGHGYRPDDILTALNGKTIEVLNTDAEGRLVLADALTYAERTFKPRAMIDIATLTGAVLIALGTVRAGVLSNSSALAQSLLQAGERTFERLWQLPLDEEYFDQIKGDDSDIKNVGGRKAGTIIGGMFLKQFVTDTTAWAHIDMAGMMSAEKDLPYCPKGGMGFGVRLFIDYLENL